MFAVLHLARIALAFGLSYALITPSAAARADDTSDAPPTTEVSTAANGPRGRVWYEDGLNVESAAGNFSARFELRGQFRYTDIDLDADSGFGSSQTEDSELKINRARFKMGGHAGRDWMKYYTEYELKKGVLLDLWIAPQPDERLGFRIGQYKVPYNRERFDSSGKQQFAERSIVTPVFTLDRQIGAAAMGRLFSGQAYDSSYATGVFLGNGRGGSRDDDSSPMLFGRWQWNMSRRVLPFSRSDLKRHPEPTGSVAIALATNRSGFTRFSTDGGGQLPGYTTGQDGQYDINQSMGEYAFMYRGWSIQTEYHWKRIDDRLNGTINDMTGFYFDTGYFFSERFAWVPEPLELAVRYAHVRPDDTAITPKSTETAIGGNWFFNGHRNKLTFDLTRLRETTPAETTASWGFRFQWDVSI